MLLPQVLIYPGIALVVAVVAAQSRGVSTHAWFTGTGLTDMFQELGDLALATVGYSVLGMAVGQFVRSAVFAVIIGFAWLIAVENIIVRIVPSVQQWMPGASLVAVASAAGLRLASEVVSPLRMPVLAAGEFAMM